MRKQNEAKHAFPCLGDDGMTLRDYFAAQLLSGVIDAPKTNAKWQSDAAAWAYQMADAMLAERERNND